MIKMRNDVGVYIKHKFYCTHYNNVLNFQSVLHPSLRKHKVLGLGDLQLLKESGALVLYSI